MISANKYRCDMCGNVVEITAKLNQSMFVTTMDKKVPLCPVCISKNPHLDIEYMEPYIKMRVLEK
jgi:NAD-dependent SIR2 family protein deacetylase